MPPRTGSSAATGEAMLIGGRFIVRQRNEAELQEVGDNFACVIFRLEVICKQKSLFFSFDK